MQASPHYSFPNKEMQIFSNNKNREITLKLNKRKKNKENQTDDQKSKGICKTMLVGICETMRCSDDGGL